jgi:protocatechuate 3,4-dioxygenase beta subunit
MSFSIRCLPAVVLLAVSLPASLWAQSTAKQTSKAPRGSISGRITIKEKGVPGVVVSLRKSDNVMPFGPFQRATTDQDGSYRIVNVAPGSYEVTPSVPAFVPDAKDALKTKTVLVGEDENVDGINFALVRGGVITGRVTDADGRPVIQQEVNIYQANAFDRAAPQQPVFRANAVQTDDRGIYRVYGLTAGRYKVAAGRGDDAYGPTFGPSRAVYRQIFHPDVTDQAKATVIEVGEASEANNVDIALGRELQTFNATGKVVDATSSLPLPNIRFGLQRIIGQRTEYANTLATSNALGDFVIEGLIPGKYAIYLFPNTAGGMRAEAATFDIVDQDVSGVTIKLFKGANVSGVVVLETEDKAALQVLTQLQVRAYVTNPGGGAVSPSSAVSPIGPDGSFSLSGLGGGTVNFNLGGGINPFPPKGFVISRIERDGAPMATRTLEVKESEQVAGVRVIVSYGTGIIRGVVKLENGTMPEGARIFLRVTKGNESPNFMRPPQVDARGQFLIDGLVAGTYEVSATLVGHTGKREVNVQDGVSADLVITIDMTAPPVRPGPPPVIRNP